MELSLRVGVRFFNAILWPLLFSAAVAALHVLGGIGCAAAGSGFIFRGCRESENNRATSRCVLRAWTGAVIFFALGLVVLLSGCAPVAAVASRYERQMTLSAGSGGEATVSYTLSRRAGEPSLLVPHADAPAAYDAWIAQRRGAAENSFKNAIPSASQRLRAMDTPEARVR